VESVRPARHTVEREVRRGIPFGQAFVGFGETHSVPIAANQPAASAPIIAIGVVNMLGSAVLETAIGLVFVYLVFSLIGSAIVEYVSGLLDRRGEHLKHILFNLFCDSQDGDAQGRVMLSLFVGHPMIQALTATDWEPTIATGVRTLKGARGGMQVAKDTWLVTSKGVRAADAARAAANKAHDMAAQATDAGAAVNAALQSVSTAAPSWSAELTRAVADAAATAAATLAAGTAANEAAEAATEAQLSFTTIRLGGPGSSRSGPAAQHSPTTGPATQSSEGGAKVLEQGTVPEVPSIAARVDEPSATASAASTADILTRARDVADQVTKAAATATASANRARIAADGFQKAKNKLEEELFARIKMPKYIPDRVFADVLLQVLASSEAIGLLSGEPDPVGIAATDEAREVATFWDRFGSALKVVGGIASRLPEGPTKTDVNGTIAIVDATLQKARKIATTAPEVLKQLENGTNGLRAAVAAIPDDAVRMALEHAIETSLQPLHALGHDILVLESAGRSIAVMADSSLKTALKAFHAQAGEDLSAFKQSVSTWFNDVMDHASGWYKRNTQGILFGVAAILCLLNNVDTVDLVRHLSTDPALRASTFAAAQKAADKGGDSAPQLSAGELKNLLDRSKLPLWWTGESLRTFSPIETNRGPSSGQSEYYFSPRVVNVLLKVLGLVISTMAVSMGAPFWFDILNRLVNVRLVGKRPEPSANVVGTRPDGSDDQS
jgi:hypothetical protein